MISVLRGTPAVVRPVETILLDVRVDLVWDQFPNGQASPLPLANDGGSACGEGDVAIEIELADGRRDLIVAVDREGRGGVDPVVVQQQWGVRVDTDLSVVRRDAKGEIERFDASSSADDAEP